METIQMLGSLGEFVGAMGVVVTLVYLAIQVRHSKEATQANTRSLEESRRAMIAQTAQARHYRTAERFEKLADSEYLARIQLQLEESGFPENTGSVEELDPLDRLRMREWYKAWRSHLANSAIQYELGYTPEEGRENFNRYASGQVQGPLKAFSIDTVDPALGRILAEAEEPS